MIFKKKTYLKPSSLLDQQLKLSFCITHKDRNEFLEQTLASNLNDNSQNSEEIEFILVDFGSKVDILEWLKTNFPEHLESGYLKFFQSHIESWHASIAKNTAHSLGQGAILVNLDCDNFTGPGGGQRIINKFKESSHNLLYWQYSKKKLDGTYGRIGLTSDLFNSLGGYDEQLLQMGFQDGDLKNRALKLGLKLEHDTNPNFNRAIKNEKFTPPDISWKEMNKRNERRSRQNIKAGVLKANTGNTRQKLPIERYDPDSQSLVPISTSK